MSKEDKIFHTRTTSGKNLNSSISELRGGVLAPRMPELRNPKSKNEHQNVSKRKRPITRRQRIIRFTGVALGAVAITLGTIYGSDVLNNQGGGDSSSETTITGTTLPSSENSITFQSLISKDKTIEDVRVAITPEGREITEPINVSDKLQKEFQKIQPGEKILFIGEHNRAEDKDSLTGNELNNSVVTVGGFKSKDESEIKFLKFGGGTVGIKQVVKRESGQEDEVTVFPQIVMQFKDIVLIPGSKDFYIHGINPINSNADVYVRMVRDINSKFSKTILQCFDLNNPDGFDYDFINDVNVKEKHLLVNVLPEKFFLEGDTIKIFTAGRINENGKLTFEVDENNKQTGGIVANIRLAGADKINDLFKTTVSQ